MEARRPGQRPALRWVCHRRQPVACWHGRIDIRRKGLDILVKAWSRVCAERPEADLRLLLCGGGAGNEKAQAADGGGWPARGPLARRVHYRQADRAPPACGLGPVRFPLRHEGFAVAPMEAMACGRAVVACDAPGVADLLRGGEAAGGIGGRQERRALAGAMGSDDRERAWRMGAARRRIEERYSPEAIGRVW